MMEQRVFTATLDQLPLIAQSLIPYLKEKSVVAFYGLMGVGKTTFIKSLCEALGVEDVINSPTFAIVNEYTQGDGDPVYHFDFYRINTAEEAFDFGYEEYFYSGYPCLIEWPELIESLLPEELLKIFIKELEDGRREIIVQM